MLEEAYEERGYANVLIAGRTGVGKSTLINSVFQGNLAKTGQGRPVTENTREITKEGVPLSVFDTRGLEMADFSGTLGSLEKFVSDRHSEPDEKRHIHVAWVCAAEDSRRVEDAETELTAMLFEFVPVIGVITRSRADQGFRAKVQRLLPQAKNVVRVRALREQFDDGHFLRRLRPSRRPLHYFEPLVREAVEVVNQPVYLVIDCRGAGRARVSLSVMEGLMRHLLEVRTSPVARSAAAGP